MPLRLAHSPCPNDTFVFHALAHGLIPGAPEVDITFADVDVTNTAALAGEYDLVKVSYAALPWLLERYQLLPCGGALGRGCGPLVLVNPASPAGADPARIAAAPVSTAAPESFAGVHVAVPGERTTAYLLMRLWAAERAPASVTVLPFHEIMPAVAAGRYGAGLVIHEARFTYPRYGLHALVDLGEWWEKDTGLPIPLGAIMARRGAVDPNEAADWIRASVRYAWAHPSASRDYVLGHAQEMDHTVVAQHIELYVNRHTENLDLDGYAAVNALLGRAAAAGLVPPAPALP
jgi:1,4-dihydroxy-6-naphthoate synthase